MNVDFLQFIEYIWIVRVNRLVRVCVSLPIMHACVSFLAIYSTVYTIVPCILVLCGGWVYCCASYMRGVYD